MHAWSLRRTWLVCAGVAVGMTIMAASAAPAGAQDCAVCTLNLSGPATAPAGSLITLTATGNDQLFGSYLWVFALSTSYTTSCPNGFENGLQLATASGGSVVADAEPEDQDANGNFTNPVAFQPGSAPGTVLFCAYTQGFGTDTFAMSSLLVTFEENGTGGGGSAAKPANTAKPRVTRSGGQLRCVPGRWANSPTGLVYQWLVGGKAKAGASGTTLAINRRLRRQKVQCVVTASNTAGSSSARSAPFSVH